MQIEKMYFIQDGTGWQKLASIQKELVCQVLIYISDTPAINR